MAFPTGYTLDVANDMQRQDPPGTHEWYKGDDGLWYDRKEVPPVIEKKTKETRRNPVEETRMQLERFGYVTSDPTLLAETTKLRQDVDANVHYVPAMVLDGPAGTGKTFLAQTFTKWWPAETFLSIQAFRGISKDHFLYDLNIPSIVHAQATMRQDFTKRDTLEQGILWRALELSLTQRVVLLLDEMDKCQEEVDSLLLEFLNDCLISDPTDRGRVLRGNRKNLVVFLTKNDERDLTEPLIRRARRVNFTWPDPPTERKLAKRLALQELKGWKIHGDLDGLTASVVAIANKVRKFEKKLRKCPSPPEVARAVVDCFRLPNQYRGQSVFNWMFAYPSDAHDVLQEDPSLSASNLQTVLARF